jgi:hypothetical protein
MAIPERGGLNVTRVLLAVAFLVLAGACAWTAAFTLRGREGDTFLWVVAAVVFAGLGVAFAAGARR